MEELEMRVHIIANFIFGVGVSGGDRIFIEFSRRWSRQGIPVRVYTTEDGYKMCKDYNLDSVDYTVWHSFPSFLKPYKIGLFLLYLFQTIRGCLEAFRVSAKGKPIFFSSSDFLADSLTGLILKQRHRGSRWIASLYLFAPNPIKNPKDVHYRGGYTPPTLKTLAYYTAQRIAYPLIRRYADLILVANELDRDTFIRDGVPPERIIALYGGVDLKSIERSPPGEAIRYDGCFVGRFHPQKGVLELIDIWEEVIRKKKDAKLAMIGRGPIEKEVREKVRERGLEGNIDLLGYLDGEEKYRILKSSRVFLHPPILDTGGMAAAEGMACGLPVVGFDLPGYKYCYPRGMLKAPVGDIKAFADLVLKLFEDRDLYARVQKEALDFAKEWDWDNRADQVLRAIETVASQR